MDGCASVADTGAGHPHMSLSGCFRQYAHTETTLAQSNWVELFIVLCSNCFAVGKECCGWKLIIDDVISWDGYVYDCGFQDLCLGGGLRDVFAHCCDFLDLCLGGGMRDGPAHGSVYFYNLVDSRVLAGCSGSCGGFPTCRVGGTFHMYCGIGGFELAYLGILLPFGSICPDGCRPYFYELGVKYIIEHLQKNNLAIRNKTYKAPTATTTPLRTPGPESQLP